MSSIEKPARNKRSRSGWGGARPGAGRPRSHARLRDGTPASEPHKTRPAVAATHAVLVTARLVEAVGRLDRARELIARALDLALARDDFRIIHLALRRTQLALIVEAADKLALARGMQGFQVSAARSLNRAARRTGRVFPDRYRARILRSRPALALAIARLPAPARRRVGVPESPLFAG